MINEKIEILDALRILTLIRRENAIVPRERSAYPLISGTGNRKEVFSANVMRVQCLLGRRRDNCYLFDVLPSATSPQLEPLSRGEKLSRTASKYRIYPRYTARTLRVAINHSHAVSDSYTYFQPMKAG